MPTSLDRELEEQRRWRLRSPVSGLQVFNDLLRKEFLSPEKQAAQQDSQLQKIIRFSASHVPYYRDLFKEQGITAKAISKTGDLPRLPALTRRLIQQSASNLQPTQLPEGIRMGGVRSTSGTTGEPVKVPHTASSGAMFVLFKQRELRWFRFDPMATFAALRPAVDLPRTTDGKQIPRGTTSKGTAWPAVGHHFETGPFIGFDDANPLEDQIQWLEKYQPEYLLGQSANLEHLALGCKERSVPNNLRAIEAISQQLTPQMRALIERTFDVPVQQNYGFNEIGIVASRCPEGGRYHVHAEQAIVEIVDAEGQPCKPGERGRVLVTALSNPAMPLLRYDPDDLAEVADGPCPCGRTLPSFTEIHGRYRRTAYLPPGTWDYWDALLYTLGHMPPELSRQLRKYQLHQYRDGNFELRLVGSGAFPEAFLDCIRESWDAVVVAARQPSALNIIQLDEISPAHGHKFQNFTSDFTPPPDADPQPGS
jgi:phenylacetate-CoA ligase